MCSEWFYEFIMQREKMEKIRENIKKRFLLVLGVLLATFSFGPAYSAFAQEAGTSYVEYRARAYVAGIHRDGLKAEAVSNSSAFVYLHNPMDNPKAAEDIIEDPAAVYGYRPNPESTRLGVFADYDFTNEATVAEMRKNREAYHAQIKELYVVMAQMKDAGASVEEIARTVSTRRNEIRLESYKDDPEGLAKVKASNLAKYGNENGPTPEYLYEKYGSWETVMLKAAESNAGADACLGLYDIYFCTYGVEDTSLAPAHYASKIDLEKATCSEDGCKAHWICQTCGRVFLQEDCKESVSESDLIISRPGSFDLSSKTYNYDKKAHKPSVKVIDANGKVISSSNYGLSYKNNVNAGSGQVIVSFKGEYSGSKVVKFSIKKAKQPLKLKGKTVSVKYKKLKNKNRSLAVSKVMIFNKKAVGKCVYSKKSGSKCLKIDKATGKISVKKGSKKGNYKIKVLVKAAGNSNYESGSRQVTVKVKVK